MRRLFPAAILLLCGCSASAPQPPIDIESLIAFNDRTFDVALKSAEGAPAAEVQAAMLEVRHALEALRPQISTATALIARRPRPTSVGMIEPASISACIETNVGTMPAFEQLDRKASEERMRNLLAGWLSSSIDCASYTSAYLSHVAPTDQDLRYVMGVTYPMALAMHASISFDGQRMPVGISVALIESYQRENEQIIRELAPKCRESRVRTGAQSVDVLYECVAHTGRKAHGKESYKQGRLVTAPLDRMAINAEATRLTSRGLALNVQPKLETLRRTLSVYQARESTALSYSNENQPAR